MKKILSHRAQRVLTTDPYVQNDPDLLPLEEMMQRSDILILCAPHQAYRDLKLNHEAVVDIRKFWGQRSLITGECATVGSV